MKSLLIMRHAKAEQPSTHLIDFDRDLTRRGKADAERAGRALAGRGIVPEVIVTSAARRARKTAKRAAQSSGYPHEIIETEDLYDAGIPEIVQVVRSIPNAPELAMIVGHNPGFGDFVYAFGRPLDSFPTSAVAQIQFPIDEWRQFDGTSRGELIWLWTPESSEPTETALDTEHMPAAAGADAPDVGMA